MVEIRRVAFDAKFEVLGLNLTVELLGMNVRRKSYVNIDLVKGLIPLEHLLTVVNEAVTLFGG